MTPDDQRVAIAIMVLTIAVTIAAVAFLDSWPYRWIRWRLRKPPFMAHEHRDAMWWRAQKHWEASRPQRRRTR